MASNSITVGDVTIEYVTMTPAWAKEILDSNVNRSIRPKRVQDYAADMKSGRWQFNGDSVRIDINGNLRDGQHRLKACVESGVSFDTVLITGLPPKTQSTMDTGARRTVADTLELAGYSHPNLLGSSLGLIHMWETQGILLRKSEGALQPNGAVEIAQRHPDIARFVRIVNDDPLKTAPAPSSLIAALYLINQGVKDDLYGLETKFNKFVEGTIKGLGLVNSFDPRHVLRTRFSKIKEGEPGRDNIVAATVAWLTIRAWVAFLEDEEITRFQVGGSTKFTFSRSEYWLEIPGDKLRFSKATDDVKERFGIKAGAKEGVEPESKVGAAA